MIVPNVMVFNETMKTSIHNMKLEDCNNNIAQCCKSIATTYEVLAGANVDYDDGIFRLFEQLKKGLKKFVEKI